jgi:uncharacterized Zn finger protein
MSGGFTCPLCGSDRFLLRFGGRMRPVIECNGCGALMTPMELEEKRPAGISSAGRSDELESSGMSTKHQYTGFADI